MAFESPGDLLFASRLGLLPNYPNLDEFLSELPIFHFGNTYDPIYLGQCIGPSSSCYWFDYALESKCHVGKECIYDASNAIKYQKGAKTTTLLEDIKNLYRNVFKKKPFTSTLSKSKISIDFKNVNEDNEFKIESVRWHSLAYIIPTLLEKANFVPEVFLF
jgi:lipase ATG15